MVPIRAIPGKVPRIDPDAFVDPAAQVVGHVIVEAGASVWPFTILRGDQNYVRLGRDSNAQDLSVLHVTERHPCIVGSGVTIGHRAVVHGATVMDHARIGIGAIVLNGAVVEEGAQVGAGAVVPPGKVVPAGWLVMGIPAKPVRQMSPEELADIRDNAVEYVRLWREEYSAQNAVAAWIPGPPHPAGRQEGIPD
jgi:carbonic anhydrase/acetyltransferase-like protein (isoleucine patch superfamily)